MKYGQAAKMYLDSCKGSGKTACTLQSYGATLAKFGDWLNGQGMENVEDVKTLHLDAFKCERAEQVSASSLNLALTHLRCFFEWVYDMELVERNPFKKSITVDKSALRAQQNKPYTHLLSEKELRGMLTNTHPANTHKTQYTRNAALLLVFLTTGLRNESVRELRVRDLDFEQGRVKVDNAKGNKSGYAPLTDLAAKAVRAYLADHPGLRPDDYLFGWTDGNGEWKPFSRTAMSNTVAAAVQSYTGRPGIYSHALRHSFASILANRGFEDREISLLLFHSDGTGAAVTRKYISDDLGWLYRKVNDTFNKIARVG